MGQTINTNNISQNTNISSPKETKLDVGEVFSAKVIKSDNGNGDIVLKLKDGRQINAKLDGQVDININNQNKFLVEASENGEIKVRLLQDNTKPNNNLEQIVKKFLGVNANSSDYSMIKALIKYNIPLTKENILYAKTIMDFQNNINVDKSKVNIFIDKYLASRGIDENSAKGEQIKNIIKEFCSELNNIENEELATFMENGIDISGDNIKSFNNIFKNDSTVFKALSDIMVKLKNVTGNEQKTQIINEKPVENNTEKSPNKTFTKMDANISKIISLGLDTKLEGGKNIMPNISNVNNQVGIQNKSTRKLSFDVGEIFGARIVSYDGEKGEAVLKLSDGWKFSAKLSNSINLDENAFYKFKVDGYEDGKISLKTVKSDDTNKNSRDSALDKILNEYAGDSSNSEDYTLLKSLLKHGLPLTKDNISFAKSIMDFRESIIKTPEKEEEFINAYLNSKGLDENNSDVKDIKTSIKNFFSELKGFTTEELATFIENGIEVTDKNIKSFNNVFQKDSVINKELQDIKQEISSIINNKDVEMSSEKTFVSNSIKDVDKNASKVLIEEINSKINEMKDTIKQLTNINDLEKLGMNKSMDSLIKNINDFKVFNTISQGYYYMDVPIKFKDNDYNFKMIIKDDRKSGKKIDSKNVKLATSIKTINMGVVDAYIAVNNKNLNIDIKAEEKWTKILSLTKNILMNKVQNMGYNVNVNVKEKEEDFNIINCRDFFNDGVAGNLDTRV
ncbi:hypothetical protein SAMN02745134_03571 [Clostridium acidisoli DSM 12555]|uniref:Flagellar hook-length control protein FliK n=1 Tax=Clostridium acidisoli DSM 12555 TaxID=1121291 RepID=A0A1W1XXE5_9CLOT|nr:hypothetical protein [Clostridium acidisoli]SMC28596.1 hypothetical protein SAMN02745134_03571 [Clostridium acidisoli DSM 12555]